MFSPGSPIVIPPLVSPWTSHGIGFMREEVAQVSPASGTFENADNAVYMPILLPVACVIRRVWWVNGADVSASATVECGVYGDSGYGPGAKIVSGSATQSGASVLQFVDCTDTAIGPGLYWIAVVASSSASGCTLFRASVNAAAASDAAYRFNQTSGRPLPATATPAEATYDYIYLCGFSTTSSP